ncbi:UNVERIFIED_CONTAM: hypothetical protein FKN15_054613 [Acipenser sinensis]
MALFFLLCSLPFLAVVTSQPNFIPDEPWVNMYRQGFNFQCPHGEVITAIRSYFSETEGSDRLLTFECQPTPSTMGEPTKCWWDDINRGGQEWYGIPFVMTLRLEERQVPHLLYLFTEDVPMYYKEEGDIVIENYGYFIRGASTTFSAVHRFTEDVPEHYKEEGDIVIENYGYFIRGASTTFSAVHSNSKA